MTRASMLLATFVAVAYAAEARAQPEARPSVVDVTPPDGWVLDAGRSAAQAKALADTSHAGGTPRTSAVFFRSPTPGAMLLVGQVTFEPAPADPVAAARAELTALHDVVESVGGTLVTWRFQGADPLLPEARLEWTDPSVGTTSITRALVMRSAGSLSIVTAECVVANDAAALRAPCEAALAAVKPSAALARVEAGLGAIDPVAAAAGGGRAAAGAGGDGPVGGGGAPSVNAPRLGQGPTDLPSTILVRPPSSSSSTDRRPLYLIAGIAVLALVFLWNRRQRGRLEAAEARERRARGRGSDDDDRDDDARDDRAAGDTRDDAQAAAEAEAAAERRRAPAPPTDAAARPVPGAPDDLDDGDDPDEPDDEDLGKPRPGRPTDGKGGKEHA